MPSENYRYYCLDGAGRLHDAKWFHAETDEDAITRIQSEHPDATCEIWQDGRLVAQLGPTAPFGLAFSTPFQALPAPREWFAGCPSFVDATAIAFAGGTSPSGQNIARLR